MNTIHVTSGGKTVTLANESQRNEFINDAIAEEIKAGAPSLEVAYANAEKRFPAVFATMKHPSIKMPHKPKDRTFANINSQPAPVFGSAWKAIFHLPQAVDQATCEAAWAANGNQGSQFNYVRIFDGLTAYLQKQRGISLEAAQAAAKDEFQALYQTVKVIMGAYSQGQPFKKS